jgi:hypothetical protein
MIQKFSCPSCAAELIFRSSASLYVTCPSCKSLVLRKGTDVELIGKVSDLMGDMTVIQPRTKGKYNGRSFDVLGRLRVAWEDGFWNEWAVESNGNICWLSEAQGFFVFYDKVEAAAAMKSEGLVAGVTTIKAPNGDAYTITDIKKAKIVGVEGEVPGKVELNVEYTSIDLQKDDEHVGTLDIKSSESFFSYGHVQDVKDFHFEYLRQIDGW